MTDRPTYVPTDPRELAEFVELAPPVLHSDEEHRQMMFDHVKWLAGVNPSYARWAAGAMARDNPTMHHDLLKRLDEWMSEQGWGRPRTFSEFMEGLLIGNKSL